MIYWTRDLGKDRLSLWSPDGSTLLGEYGTTGVGLGQFREPDRLA